MNLKKIAVIAVILLLAVISITKIAPWAAAGPPTAACPGQPWAWRTDWR